jgi:hypothetical protein
MLATMTSGRGRKCALSTRKKCALVVRTMTHTAALECPGAPDMRGEALDERKVALIDGQVVWIWHDVDWGMVGSQN